MFDWGTRLIATMALLAIIGGLLVLALPDPMEGQEVVPLDENHGLRVADAAGAVLVAIGILMAWGAVVYWHRKRIQV